MNKIAKIISIILTIFIFFSIKQRHIIVNIPIIPPIIQLIEETRINCSGKPKSLYTTANIKIPTPKDTSNPKMAPVRPKINYGNLFIKIIIPFNYILIVLFFLVNFSISDCILTSTILKLLFSINFFISNIFS